jgi:hypothetical protein
MAGWWKEHESSLPILTHDNKVELEDITGCVPLLLKGLLEKGYKGKPYSEMKEDFLGSAEIIKAADCTAQFAETAKLRWSSQEFLT